jgi:hypothetical protein
MGPIPCTLCILPIPLRLVHFSRLLRMLATHAAPVSSIRAPSPIPRPSVSSGRSRLSKDDFENALLNPNQTVFLSGSPNLAEAIETPPRPRAVDLNDGPSGREKRSFEDDMRDLGLGTTTKQRPRLKGSASTPRRRAWGSCLLRRVRAVRARRIRVRTRGGRVRRQWIVMVRQRRTGRGDPVWDWMVSIQTGRAELMNSRSGCGTSSQSPSEAQITV